VLARLREVANPGGLGLPELSRGLRGDAADVEFHRLKEVAESLERDGLARVTRQGERPEAHPAGAVAEERAPYSTGVGQEDTGEIRVSLP